MPRDTTTMTAEQRELTNEKMWSLLKERVSYCFAEGVSGQSRWKLGTWARKVSKSNIVKFGTDSDKSYLDNQTVATRRSAPRPNRKRKTAPSYPHRQKRRIDAGKRSGESLYGRPGLSGAQEAIIEGERRRAEEHGVVPPDEPFARHDLETPAAHLQWLVDEFGNNRIGRKPVQIQPDGVGRRGRCALPDCQLPTCQLEGGAAIDAVAVASLSAILVLKSMACEMTTTTISVVSHVCVCTRETISRFSLDRSFKITYR